MKNKHSNRTIEPKSKFRKKSYYLLVIITCLILGGSILAQTNTLQYVTQLSARLVDPTPTPAKQTNRKKRKNTSGDNAISRGEDSDNLTSPVLARTEFNLVGLAVTANPANQTVPKNTPTGILTSIRTPEGTDPAEIIAGLDPNYKIRGELVGPSFTSPRPVEASIGQTISIPPLQNAGDHVVQNLRVVDTGTAGSPVITSVEPDSVGITVINNILVSQVQVTEMTYEEILQSGINITDDNYTFFNFVLGLTTSSGTVPINIPVALPSTGGQNPPVIGAPNGVGVSGIELPTVLPVMLQLQDIDEEGEQSPPMLPGGGGPVRIPGVVVFPGRIGLLNQFFEAIVIVANGAPDGTPLVLTTLKAKANLPDAGTPNDTSDDPLRIAETQQAGQTDELPLHGLGEDGVYGTADDITSFNPGQSGQASFLIEGLKEGLHTINFDLEGTLAGLPTGPVTVTGKVPGVVLVKDADFSVSFTHPATVRAGQEYDLGLSIYNSGSRDLQNIIAELKSNSVSGAELIDDERKTLTETILQGETATIKWRLRSNITGAVTATYTKVGDEIESGLNLVTGVGDRNVPLSPESLILPPPVEKLSPNIVEAARQMLGQSWSVANAPPGGLPAGVVPINKQVVINKAIELGFAGLRVDFGEPEDTALKTLMRDWLGENGTSSNGFADSLRNTPAGYYFYDSVGTKFYEKLNGGQSNVLFNQLLADTESPRSAFLSAYVSQDSGDAKFGAKLISPNGQVVGWGANNAERSGDLKEGFGVDLLQNDPRSATNQTRGKFLLASRPLQGNWQLEVTGWETGVADISVLVPTSGKDYRLIEFNSLSINAGEKYRITFSSAGQNSPTIAKSTGGTFQTLSISPSITNIFEKDPSVIGAVQLTPDVVSGGDKFGRLVGVLFSKPMTRESAENPARYQIGGGNLIGAATPTQIGKPIGVTGANQNFASRFSVIALETPVGPFIERNVKISGVVDNSGRSIFGAINAIDMRVSPQGSPPGAYVTGRVINADGTPVPNSLITYLTDETGSPATACPVGIEPDPIANRISDENGEFQFDYVRQGYCFPVLMNVTNVATNSQKTQIGNILYNGQHLILDTVFLARGSVTGTVTNAGQPLADAYVTINPELDPFTRKVVRTDSAGVYQADDVAVGNLVVKAIGTEEFSLATGISSGTIEGPGQTAVIDVTTQNISGKISGKVVNSDAGQTPVNGAFVVARAFIPGFPSANPIPVGYSFTNPNGDFDISNLPIGNVSLSVLDPQNNVTASTAVQLTSQITEVEGVLITMPGFGSISGKVTNDAGQAMPSVIVRARNQAVLTDVSGNYTLQRLQEGSYSVSARDGATGLSGGTSTSLQSGEVKTDVNIIIKRPGTLLGQVSIVENGITQPVSGALVTVNGTNIVATDTQGNYQLENVSPGAVQIRFVEAQKKLFINTTTVIGSDETVIRNATFRPGKIFGKVTQPDGAEVVAPVTLRIPIPNLNPGFGFGFPLDDAQILVQTDTNGDYSVSNVNPGDYVVSASNPFFPIRVSKSDDLPPSGEHEVNLQLVDTLAGKISGHIYEPDGITPVKKDVRVSLGGGSLADITVKTNEDGYYEFAEVFASGNYSLTATDLVSTFTNRVSIAVESNQDLTADLTLRGRGNLKVNVVDGAGNPVPNGSIRINGSGYPYEERFVELVQFNNGTTQFNNLTEGDYAVSANYTNLGGRGTATVTYGGLTEVTIQVQSTGRIEGQIVMPDGTTPVGLADVTLRSDGRIIGFLVSSDTEEERGKFIFDNVVEGDFTIDGFDNRTGRSGRAFGTISEQGEIVNINVRLLARGNVVGQVTSNGNPVDHAVVNLYANGSGISSTYLIATTDSLGNYRFTGIPVGSVSVRVTDGPGGLGGSANGVITGTVEPLPDTVINVALTPTVTVTGKIYKLGGTEIFTGAKVNVRSGTSTYTTTSNLNGDYQVNFVPLGTIKVSAEAPSGFDRGQATDVIATQQGETIISNVVMNGVGTIDGTALDSDGTLLDRGTVTFTNSDFGNITITASVQSDGTYRILNAPSGNYALKLALADRIGVGTAVGILQADQTLDIPLQLEPAGSVTGKVFLSDETTPAAGADIFLFLVKQSNGSGITFRTHADANGDWKFDNLPLGNVSITINEPNSGGVASIGGLVLDTNGQILDTGTINLDDTPISVVSVTPNDTAVDIATDSQVVITFNEPVRANTVGSGTVRLLQGNNAVASTRTISTDGTSVTIAPDSDLQDAKVYTVVVTTSVKDLNGLSLQQQFESTFTTADETAPSITQIAPATGSNQIPIDVQIVLVADEELDATQDFASSIQVSDGTNNIGGDISLDPTGKVITFAPSSSLTESTNYTISVNGLKDLVGNTQTQQFVSTFATLDTSAPIVNPLPIDNTSVRTYTPTITATYSDNASGINTSSVVLTLDGNNVTSEAIVTGGSLSYTPSQPITAGSHTVTVQVSDNVGNVSAIRTANFTVDDSGPIISSFTIGGVPAVNNAQVSTSLTPLFEINYTDDTGINATATKLYLGYNGTTPTEVSATVNDTQLTYQSATPMAEGVYVVRAVIENNLGTSTDTGEINFILDPDAPDIQTVTPTTGNQHGGTVVTLEGLRLLNTNNTAPTVTIGNNPTSVSSIMLGIDGNPDLVVISTPAGVPGDATIKVTTDRGTGNAVFGYEADPRTPFAEEPDTRLLWHLDELTNGTTQIIDSSYLSIDGISDSASIAEQGRFAGGRSKAWMEANNDFGALNFAGQSFTVETWVKTNPVGQDFVLVARGSGQNTGHYLYTQYSLDLLQTGKLRARFFNQNSQEWKTEMLPTVYAVDDNQWHLITMVVDEDTDQMKLYVDGIERASSNKPTNFGDLRNISNYRLHAGKGVSNGIEFPGILDEIRVSSTAHTAQQIQQTYLGSEGTNGLQIYNNSLILTPIGRTTRIELSGYGLAGLEAIAFDSQNNSILTEVLSSSATRASVLVTPSEQNSLGDTNLQLTSPAGSFTLPFRVVDSERIVFSSEADTRVLWHLDETTNGTTQIIDAGPLSIDGISDSASIAEQGRFAGGRSKAWMEADDDFGALNFTGQSFTIDTWVKTNPVGQDFVLVARGSGQNTGHYLYTQYSLELLQAGTLRARFFNQNSQEWKTEMLPTVYDVDDNQWHLITMVVDEDTDQMKLYVDGIERTSSNKPTNFGDLRNISNYRLHAGKGVSNGTEFPGILDEIRVSSTAHTAQQIQNDFDGTNELRITSYTPQEVFRERANPIPVSTQMVINGYELEDISAEVTKDGLPIDVVVTTETSSYRQAVLNVAASQTASLGIAQLTLSKPNQIPVLIDIRIAEKNEFVAENDTVMLWHLNETTNGTTQINDAGLLSIDGISDSASIAEQGRFAGGRSKAWMEADDDFGALSFIGQSFTIDTWVKTNTVAQDFVLVGKGSGQNTGHYLYTQYSLELLRTGGLRAKFYNQSSQQWKAEMLPTDYDVDDNQWHLITMVVDEDADQMKLYVDGIERSSSNKPNNFGDMRNVANYRLHAGKGVSNGIEFPGILDEIRVSSTAHTAEQIALDTFGSDVLRVIRVNPPVVQRGEISSINVTGNGFNDATIATNVSNVNASVTSSSISELSLNVDVSPSASLGIVQLQITDISGNTVNIEITVVDQQPFVNSTETKFLWHLNETTNGTTMINGSDSLPLNGISDSASIAEQGRFAGGRSKAWMEAEDDLGALSFIGQSFTIDTWVKTNTITQDFVLIGKGSGQNTGHYLYTQYSLELLRTGGLRAKFYNQSSQQWKAEILLSYNPQTGFWGIDIDDNQWHLITMVVDEDADQMKLYVDGIERAVSNKPTNFGDLRNVANYRLQAGKGVSNGTEFPGILDEIRIVDYARSPQEIADTWFGTNTSFSRLLKNSKKVDSKKTISKKERLQTNPPKLPEGSGNSKDKISLQKVRPKIKRAEEVITLDRR